MGDAEALGRMNCGVPQGSPLSPILFVIFLDQILKEVSGLTNIQAFADDILLWIRVDRHHFNSQKLSIALQKLEVWAEEWNMKFCPEKCVVMCISRLRRCDPPPEFRFCGQALTQVRSM